MCSKLGLIPFPQLYGSFIFGGDIPLLWEGIVITGGSKMTRRDTDMYSTQQSDRLIDGRGGSQRLPSSYSSSASRVSDSDFDTFQHVTTRPEWRPHKNCMFSGFFRVVIEGCRKNAILGADPFSANLKSLQMFDSRSVSCNTLTIASGKCLPSHESALSCSVAPVVPFFWWLPH